jgi:broad specificity phosphatase PhoE
MKVAVFRHAERQSGYATDPELSPRGIRQSISIKDKVEDGSLPKPDVLITSPKRRAFETFEPVSQARRISIQKEHTLDERTNKEDINVFRHRVHKFIEDIEDHQGKTVFICTHLDWIEEFSTLLPCDTDLHALMHFAWSPGSYMLFEVGEVWHLLQRGEIT